MKLIVIGPRGKMGCLITQSAVDNPVLELVGAIAPKGREYIGKDLGQVAKIGQDLGVLVTDDLEAIIQQCDVMIDFSTKENASYVVKMAVKYQKALVCGTTGFSKEEFQMFEEAGKSIPMLYAANTSKMVHLMNEILEMLASKIGNESDIEIIEMHDQWKLDVPSGTSKEMGMIMADAMNQTLDEVAVYGRESGRNPRKKGTIGYHSVRAGSIPSSHTVYFGGLGERLEITHHSYNWQCFAKGACECAVFLKDKESGFYSVNDALN